MSAPTPEYWENAYLKRVHVAMTTLQACGDCRTVEDWENLWEAAEEMSKAAAQMVQVAREREQLKADTRPSQEVI